MKISRRLIGLALAVIVLGLAACQPLRLPLLGRAPAWKLKDLDGKEVSSEQFHGKIVVVDFWATWCVPCIGEIPGYIKLQEKYGKDGLVIVGISIDENGPAQVKKFTQEKGMNYQVVMGTEEVQAVFGGLEAVPTTFLIDRTGQIRDRKMGAEPAAEYEKKIKAVLN
jgi:thiol-disulfide isomerase/thioredoxin